MKTITIILISVLMLSVAIAGMTASLAPPKNILDVSVEKNSATDTYKNIQHRVSCDGYDCRISIYDASDCNIDKETQVETCKELIYMNEYLDFDVLNKADIESRIQLRVKQLIEQLSSNIVSTPATKSVRLNEYGGSVDEK